MKPITFATQARVMIVAGKGGVGKTTVTASLAKMAADAGLRTLIVEVEGKSGLPELFGRPESLTYREQQLSAVGPGEVRARTLTPDDALVEYLNDHGLRRISKRLSSTGTLDVLATAVPGIRDLLVLGKVKQLEQALAGGAAAPEDAEASADPANGAVDAVGSLDSLDEAGPAAVGPAAVGPEDEPLDEDHEADPGDSGRGADFSADFANTDADFVIVDAPAAGHAVQFLNSAQGLLDAVSVGPIRTQAQEVVKMIGDPSRCQVLLVTLPEETPVNELVETAYRIEDEAGVQLAPIVVNGMYPRLDVATDPLEAAAAAGVKLTSGETHALKTAAQFRRRRQELQAEQTERLAAALPLPQIQLPYLFTTELGRKDIDFLAQAMAAGVESIKAPATGPIHAGRASG